MSESTTWCGADKTKVTLSGCGVPQGEECSRKLQDVVRLITDEGYYIPAAAKVCGTNDQTVRNWHGRFAFVPVSAGDDATVEELPVAEVARHSVHVR